MLREINRSPRHHVTTSPVKKYKSIVLSILSGIVSALPFCDGRLWILAWFGFVPLFLALRNKSRLQSFLLSYLCGIIFWSITIYWLIHVTLLGQILLIAYLAVYFGFFGIIISSLVPALPTGRQASSIVLFLIPSVWVILEYVRSHVLTGFGWALLGYSQYLNLPIIQIADIFGVYGVSFVIMMVNVTIYNFVVTKSPSHPPQSIGGCPPKQCGGDKANSKRYICFTIITLFIYLLYGFLKLQYLSSFALRPSPFVVKLSLIQGNIPQELKWALGSQPLILERYTHLTQKAALENPDLIIWPEASSPGFYGDTHDRWIAEHIFSLAEKTNIPVLFGTVVKENEEYFNSALLINKEGKLSGRYDKLHLVPFGEYIPLKNSLKFLETIVPIGDFTSGREYVLFSLPTNNANQASRIKNQGSAIFSVLICFEDTIPELARNFVKKGAAFLVTITNDAWFQKTSAPFQHLSASVFRAVENRVPLVRAANTGVSCFIDGTGKITARVSENGKEIFIPGIKFQDVFLRATGSLYTGLGDIFILACCALAGFCGIIFKK